MTTISKWYTEKTSKKDLSKEILNKEAHQSYSLMADHRSSGKEHKADALALGAEEGRGKLRKAAVSCKQAP